MTPARRIAALDQDLARTGESVTLRRGSAAPFTDLVVRAAVRVDRAGEIAGGVVAADVRVILSPTGLDAAAWVNAAGAEGSAPFNPDRRVPRIGDRIIVQGRNRRIETVTPILVGDVLVRIELTARG